MKRKASSEQDLTVDRDRREDPSTFYTKYLWKQISRNGEEESGRILRTIYIVNLETGVLRKVYDRRQ